jgi:hypothetical protein
MEQNCTSMKFKLVLLVCTIALFSHCNKDGKACWQAFNPQGYDEPGLVLCNKTKAEAEAAYPQFWFYRAGETKYCWEVQIGGNKYYAWDVPESIAQKQIEENGAYRFTKIDCHSFCHCEWYEKHKSKITALFNSTRLITETLVSADSCSKLSVGKVVIVRETADSLITRELVKKFP